MKNRKEFKNVARKKIRIFSKIFYIFIVILFSAFNEKNTEVNLQFLQRYLISVRLLDS